MYKENVRKCPRCRAWTDADLFSQGVCPACHLACYGKVSERQATRLKELEKTKLNIPNIEKILKVTCEVITTYSSFVAQVRAKSSNITIEVKTITATVYKKV